MHRLDPSAIRAVLEDAMRKSLVSLVCLGILGLCAAEARADSEESESPPSVTARERASAGSSDVRIPTGDAGAADADSRLCCPCLGPKRGFKPLPFPYAPWPHHRPWLATEGAAETEEE
jgi:hypothetical protein